MDNLGRSWGILFLDFDTNTNKITILNGSLQNVHRYRANRVTPDHARTLILTVNLVNPNPITISLNH